MAQIQTWYKQDLTQPVHVHHLPGNVFSQDNQGNLIGVEVFDNGVSASLSGSVSASIIRSDGATVIASGTLSGNKASVVLPSEAYAVPGVISIVLKLTTGIIVTTLLAMVAVMYQSTTDTAVDPGNILPSIQQLEEQIDSLVASIPSDFSQVVSTLSGSDQYAVDLVKTVLWEKGTLVSGVPADNNARIRSDFINISDTDRISFNVKTGYKYSYALYDSLQNWISSSDWYTSNYTLQVLPTYGYIRIIISNTSDTASALEYVEQVKAKRTPHIREGLNESNTDIFDLVDIELPVWSIGYVYQGGGIAPASDQPNYISNKATQILPFDAFVFPDNGYQIMVRFYEDQTSPVWSVDFTRGAVFIPANTAFLINASKTTPEAVVNVSDYVSHIHVVRADIFSNIPPNRKNTLKMAVLGDSISTYTGYSEDDVSLQGSYYPTGNVTNVEFTWWKILAEYLHATSISVSAISRSAFYDFGESAYPPMYDDDRITRLGANGEPDIVFVMAGTNDGFTDQTEQLTYEYDVESLEELPDSTMKGIALTIRKIQVSYPNARIVMLIPKAVKLSDMQTGYDNERVCKIAEYIKELSEEYGVYKVIDLRKCGINQSNVSSFMTDGSIHPNANGMRYIAQYIISELPD